MEKVDHDIVKAELREWIDTISDDRLLQLLNLIKNSDQPVKSDWWDELSDVEKENINHGLEDLKQGRVIDSASFWKALDGQ